MTWVTIAFTARLSFFPYFAVEASSLVSRSRSQCIVRRDWTWFVPKSQGSINRKWTHGPRERQSAPAAFRSAAFNGCPLTLL